MWDLSGGETTIASVAQVGGMIEGQPSWSPDGRALAFAGVRAHERGSAVWIARGLTSNAAAASGAAAAEAFVSEPGNQNQPAFSPDGRWLAYHTDGPGAGIYVRPFPGPGSVSQIAAGGGPFRWVGHELFFVQGRQIMAVTMTTSHSLEIGAPRPVLTLPDGATFADVSADGQQFLLLKTVSDNPPDPTPHEFHVVINFVDEMKRKVAAGQQEWRTLESIIARLPHAACRRHTPRSVRDRFAARRRRHG